MGSSVEKVDSVAGASQHRKAARPRQLRASLPVLVVAVFAAARLAAQQEPQRVVRGLSFEGNHAIDHYTLSAAIATTNSSTFATSPFLRWLGLGEKRPFNELEFRRDVVRLLLLYRQSGHMNAVIDTVVRREARDVYVKFRIYEGDPVRLTRLDVLGVDSILDVPAVKRALPLQVGDPFNRALFQASADTIVGRLKNRGYPYADVLRSYDVDAAALRAVAGLEGVPGRRALARLERPGLEAGRGLPGGRRVPRQRVPLPARRSDIRYRQLQRHARPAAAGVLVAAPHGEPRPVRGAALGVQGVHAAGYRCERRGHVQRPARHSRHRRL